MRGLRYITVKVKPEQTIVAMSVRAEPVPSTGDMPPEELRRTGHDAFDWIADFLAGIEEYPVLPDLRPGDIAKQLPLSAPEKGTPISEILTDFREIIVPAMTQWNHPAFFAYFDSSASGPGILGEALAAALNVNVMLWRSSPAGTELEERVLEWLREMMGLPAEFRGHIQDSASISTLVAIAAAREAAGLSIREEGLSGRDLPALRLYCSMQGHSSIEKAGLTLGLGTKGTHRIATDSAYRMDPLALEAAIRADLEAGHRPFCVVATVGTTSTTSIDPVEQIADICRRYGLWLHVDAAYGGSAALLPEMRPLMAGMHLADSIVVNPHKWLFVPIDCSALYFRDPSVVRRAFSLVPEYLATPEGDSVTNLMDYGPALGRRFRALKLWMVLRYFGREGIASRIRDHIRLAGLLASWIEAEPGWTVLAPVPFSTVCFRFEPNGRDEGEIEALNSRIVDKINSSGEAFIAPTRLDGRLSLRIAIGNIRTEERHVARVWELLRNAAQVLS